MYPSLSLSYSFISHSLSLLLFNDSLSLSNSLMTYDRGTSESEGPETLELEYSTRRIQICWICFCLDIIWNVILKRSETDGTKIYLVDLNSSHQELSSRKNIFSGLGCFYLLEGTFGLQVSLLSVSGEDSFDQSVFLTSCSRNLRLPISLSS